MRKVFKAVPDAPGTCEKQWIADDAKTPRGWADSTADAQAAAPEPDGELELAGEPDAESAE